MGSHPGSFIAPLAIPPTGGREQERGGDGAAEGNGYPPSPNSHHYSIYLFFLSALSTFFKVNRVVTIAP